jgi:hypothetical protein
MRVCKRPYAPIEASPYQFSGRVAPLLYGNTGLQSRSQGVLKLYARERKSTKLMRGTARRQLEAWRRLHVCVSAQITLRLEIVGKGMCPT